MERVDGGEVSCDPEPIVVGMGASAGGLDALQRFFDHMPAAHNLAFVVVMHRASAHASLLPAILVRHSTMPIVEASDGIAIAARRVYLAPPGTLVDIADRRLRVTPGPAGASLAIDHFFRSLARDRKERAIGVILSGSGSDGTLGLREIKAVAGMVMVQEEASARYAGMPHSAIATELVDYVLPVEECPQQLLDHVGSPVAARRAARKVDGGTVGVLGDIIEVLRRHTGHDFARYKASALRRRIDRRMTANGIDKPEAYLRLLGERRVELDALFHELLIGVTSFFRDPQSFAALGTALDRMLDQRPANQPVRAWVTGCATGEEAYSVAIALRESAGRVGCHARLQVFATDIDDQAIHEARRGEFPDSIAADLSPERLERYFTRQDGVLRIKRDIRDLLVFSEHNLLVNPPFCKLDLISCRNVLIYLDLEAQKDALALLTYALRPGGLLLLGASESTGAHAEAFECVDRHGKLFTRRAGMRAVRRPRFPRPGVVGAQVRARDAASQAARAQRDLVDQLLLEQLVPPSVLVNQSGEVLHVHGKTGRFLEPSARRSPVSSIKDVIRPDLDLHVGTAIRRVAGGGDYLHPNIEVHTGAGPIRVDLRARRVESPSQLSGLVLLTFEEVEPPRARAPAGRDMHASPPTARGDLEGLESAYEQLQTTNEELRSTNEELLSENNELETSRDELRSLNDELHAANGEMLGRIEDLSRSSDDMLNLLNSTDVAVLFLDAELKVKRYTMQATKLFNLTPSDVGRPIADLASTLEGDRMFEDASEVLRTQSYQQHRVRDRGGSWYVMRSSPYRTQAERVSGVVITFLDVTGVQSPPHIEGAVLAALECLPVVIMGQDRDLCIQWAQATRSGMDAAALIGRREDEILPREQAELIAAMKRRVMDTGVSLRAEVEMTLPGTGLTIQELWLEPTRAGDGAISGVLSVALDITRMKRGEDLLREMRAERDAWPSTSTTTTETTSNQPVIMSVARY
jgi:two-component system CheB/CheR fusion protein